MPYTQDDLYAMACMAMEEANYNPSLTEMERNNYSVFASQNMGLDKMQPTTAESAEPEACL